MFSGGGTRTFGIVAVKLSFNYIRERGAWRRSAPKGFECTEFSATRANLQCSSRALMFITRYSVMLTRYFG